jgi:beta-N-acetylhexosaminidase
MISRVFLLCCFAALCVTAQTRKGSSSPKKAAPRAVAAKPASVETQQVRQWMAGMTVRDKIAQLIIIPFYGDNPNARSRAYRRFALQVQQLRVGGLILVNRVSNGLVQPAEPTTSAAFINRMQRLARIPLIVGGDFERGASMRVNGTAKFPHNMAFAAAGDLASTRMLGAATAREARAMGVHWLFAPVADVNNNPDNPIINIRSFSENPVDVGNHVKAFIEGARSDPQHKVLVTVKHFPGHGDTAIDTHLGLGKIEATKQRLTEMELAPFRAAIAAGVDSVMTAHLWVPSIESREIPATISPAVMTELLQKELGFKGLIATDAMDMHGLSKQFPPGEAAVRALEAGVDVLLMPGNVDQAIKGVQAAVRSGRLKQKRIDESVEKLLRAKVQLALNKKKLVDLEGVNDELDLEEDNSLAQKVADGALTLVRNEGGVVPLKDPAQSCWYVLTESRGGKQGTRLAEELARRAPNAKRWALDPLFTAAEVQEAVQAGESCQSFVVAAFAGFRGNGTLPGIYTGLMDALGSSRPVILVALGNPYLIRSFPKVPGYVATFSTVQPSEVAIVKALLGEIGIGGHLPVTIPGAAKYGAGIQLPKVQ